MKSKVSLKIAALLCIFCLLCVPVQGANDWESVLDSPDGAPGDIDGNGQVDNRDVEALLWHTLFPVDYPLTADVDFERDGIVNNKDVEYLLWHTLFPEEYPLEKPHVHSFTNWTLSDYRYHSRMCSECHLIEEKVHTNQLSQSVPATCAASGYEIYNCKDCEYSFTVAISKTNEHSFTDWSSISNDRHYRSCLICSKEEIGKHAWNAGEITTPATCTTDGVLTYTCEVCMETKTSVILATNHKWQRISSVGGMVTEMCTACKETRTYKDNHSHDPADLEMMTVAKAAVKCSALGNYALEKYSRMTDVNILVCPQCGFVDYTSVKSIYTPQEATAIFIDLAKSIRDPFLYQNAIDAGFNEEGAIDHVEEYKHVSDKICINHAIRRAKEISVDYSHNGQPVNTAENNIYGGQTIGEDFQGWCNSIGHYNNMIKWAYPYVGYARYIVGDPTFETITIYSVAVFGYYDR